MQEPYMNPEPVPAASQLAVLPFLAAVDGFLREGIKVSKLRITVHRTVSREGSLYLQQVCSYLEDNGLTGKGMGRTFPVNEGIMGAAFENGRIWRTKSYPSLDTLLPDLELSMRESNDDRSVDQVALSYLAMPFLGPENDVVLILYADCNEVNFFADNDRISSVAAMCRGYCRLFDSLQTNPFPNLRNFPLQKGRPITGDRNVYKIIQESLDSIDPPKFHRVSSFNYEASAA
jgi:hypothetical protein